MKEVHGGSPITIERLRLPDASACFKPIKLLYAQLSTERAELQLSQLQCALGAPSTIVLIARGYYSQIVGTATLCVSTNLRRTVGSIESVVVDDEHRGLGIGKSLMQHVLMCAVSEGCESVQLTCRPFREKARALYASLGFKPRDDTELFRLVF